MALSIVSGPIGDFDPHTRDEAGMATIIARAVFGASSGTSTSRQAARQTARAQLLNRPDFKVTVKTTDNTAASQAIDLTDNGVTFPASTIRTVRFKSVAVNGTDTFSQEWEQDVWGNDGVTPKLLGAARLLHAEGEVAGTAVKYGRLNYHGTAATATVTDGADNDGLTLGNFSSGVATLTGPVARNNSTAMRVVAAHFSEDAGTIGDFRAIQVRAATASAGTFTVNTATISGGSEAVSSPNGTVNIDIAVFVLPPPEVKIVANSNNIEIHASYNTTDNVYHQIEVSVGKAEVRTLAAD